MSEMEEEEKYVSGLKTIEKDARKRMFVHVKKLGVTNGRRIVDDVR
jgi:hypothetical protein